MLLCELLVFIHYYTIYNTLHVRIYEAQCRETKKAENDEGDEDPIIKLIPDKSIRIVDHSVKDQSTSNEARKANISTMKGANDGFLYDLYVVSLDAKSNSSRERILSSIPTDDCDEVDEQFCEYDGSDSNSELDWINDYSIEDSLLANLSSGESDAESFLAMIMSI
ncbi:hypothetical protein Aperf_G00000111698 [Anoplocephala perfoliata]